MTRPGYLRKNKESNLAGAYSTCRRGTERLAPEWGDFIVGL